MDDPIVALSLWQGQNGGARKTSNLKEKNVMRSEEKLTSSNENHQTTLPSENNHSVESSDNKSVENKNSGDRKSESSTSGNCFPCLPGMELDPLMRNNLKKEKVSKDVSSDTPDCNEDDTNEDEMHTPHTDDRELLGTSPLPQLKSFWLLRLFESNLFTIDKALQYLYTEKDPSVQEYLGKKLFMFEPEQVDFFLLQLATMFIHMEDIYPILHKYFLRRCQYDIMFSLKLAWILNSNIRDKWLPEAELQRASRMLYSIQNEQIRPPQSATMNDVMSRHSVCQLSSSQTPHDKSHHRSFSASGINPKAGLLPYLPGVDVPNVNYTGSKVALGDLRSGRAFDTGCTCDLSSAYMLAGNHLPVCSCLTCYSSHTWDQQKWLDFRAPRLTAQDLFVHHLGNISNKLLKYLTKSLRTSHLYAELSQVNLNLPARLCLPLHSTSHHVVRIPPSEAVVLNSKSKAPYIVYVEVIECDHTYLAPLPSKQLESFVKGFGLSPDEAKHYIHSEGPSPSNTRASSMPSLRCGGCLDNTSLNSFDGTHFNDVVEEREVEERSDEDKYSCSSKGDSSCSPIESSREHEEDEDIERVTFSVGDIRRRLTKEAVGPRRMFSRDPTDPSAAAMKEPWDTKVARIQKSSPYGRLPNWKLIAAIVKWGDDLRQEMMCWQLLVQFKDVWEEESISLWIRPYVVLVLSSDGGLIEPVCNAVSLHQIKKQCKGTLLDYFKHEYGDKNSETFLTAQRNFVESSAAYCLVCYFIQVKDRHNGNILLDSTGHIIHIDFGFILANSPGNNIRFESSPFKLTEEFVEVMGGVNSDLYRYFKFLMLKGFLAARKHMDRFINIVKITQTGSQLPCFGHGPTTVQQLRERFHMSLTEEQLEIVVNRMVENSMNSLTTKLYDGFQYLANGIL